MILIFNGIDAIQKLQSEINLNDSELGQSSHWKKYHADFIFTGEDFKGLQGFGGNQKPYSGLIKAFHYILQLRYRNLSKNKAGYLFNERKAKEITKSQDRAYDLDVLRQVNTMSLLEKYFPASTEKPKKNALVIGDGFASMTSLLFCNSGIQNIYLINLSKTLLVDLWYLKLWMGNDLFSSSVSMINSDSDLDSIDEHDLAHSKIIVIQAKNHEILKKCPIDIAINIASMQEMNPDTINDYFSDLRYIASQRKVIFYCCNREEKKLPDGTLTRFNEYPWSENDKVLVDELCPWHQQYYSIKPPFYHKYDGPHRHRLTYLAKS